MVSFQAVLQMAELQHYCPGMLFSYITSFLYSASQLMSFQFYIYFSQWLKMLPALSSIRLKNGLFKKITYIFIFPTWKFSFFFNAACNEHRLYNNILKLKYTVAFKMFVELEVVTHGLSLTDYRFSLNSVVCITVCKVGEDGLVKKAGCFPSTRWVPC